MEQTEQKGHMAVLCWPRLFAISCLVNQDASVARHKDSCTPNSLSKKRVYYWCDHAWLQGHLVALMSLHPLSLCVHPDSTHLHQRFSILRGSHFGDILASKLQTSHLLALKSRGGKGPFSRIPARVPFHLMGAVGYYARCGQRMQCFDWLRVKERWVPRQKLGPVGRRGNECQGHKPDCLVYMWTQL